MCLIKQIAHGESLANRNLTALGSLVRSGGNFISSNEVIPSSRRADLAIIIDTMGVRLEKMARL